MATPAAVDLDTFKAHLNVSTTGEEAELESTLRAATAVAEGRGKVGPIIRREFTQRADCTGGLLVLHKMPVASVAAVTAVRSGATVAADLLDVDARAGLVGYASGSAIPCGPYTVTYTAGWFDTINDVDADVALAVCVIGKHLWETQRGRASRPGLLGNPSSTANDMDSVPMGYALPNRAQQLLGRYLASVGWA